MECEEQRKKEKKKRKRRSERVAEDQRDAEAFMHKVVASCIAMRGEVDAIAARLEKFRKPPFPYPLTLDTANTTD